MEVDVVVRKGDHVVGSIKRPLRDICGVPAVTYRGQLWPLNDGTIDIQYAAVPVLAAGSTDSSGDEAFVIDPDQKRIIDAPSSSRIMVQAGPGSGKTEVAARRIAHLLGNGLSPSKILVLSFSRNAVRTLTRRLSGLSEAEGQLENLRHVAIRTFDSWAFRLLRLSGEQPGPLLCKTHEANIEGAVALLSGSRAAETAAHLGNKAHVIVDEFQDLTGCRARLVKQLLDLLAPPGSADCGFTLLGDPAQAIYGWSAADDDDLSGKEVWERIRARYPEAQPVPLTRNHRSTQQIADFANGLRDILESSLKPAEKLERLKKALHGLPAAKGELGPGWIERPYRSSAILTRTNGEAVRVVQKLLGSELAAPGSGVILRAGSWASSAPAWVAALLSPLKASTLTRANFEKICAATDKRIGEAARLALSIPPCEIAWRRLLLASGLPEGDQSLPLANLRAHVEWPDAFPDDEQQPEEGLFVTTVHQSKGMEFEEVYLVEPEADGREAADPLEEASVGFVGATRAGEHLGRIGADALYGPLTKREFAKGRSRLCSWRWGWVNLEMGVPGDVAPESFVDPAVHGSAEEAVKVQEFLLEQAAQLPGRKVILVRVSPEPKKSVYDIHLQEEDGPGLKIGRTTDQLTRDLLGLLYGKGYKLPSRILDLRIAGLSTMTAGEHVEANVPEPYRTSRLWLGCTLMGTGDFKPFKGR